MKFDSLEKRDRVIRTLNYEYSIPDEFKECVKDCIREQANSNLTEKKLDEYVNKKQSLREKVKNIGFYKGKMRLEQFQGYVAEWLICMEYNTLKNKGNVVLTIINPDDTSKADLLHIIKTKYGYKCVPGPDVKASKDANYIFKQWKRNLKEKRNIPMIDFYGIITTKENREKNLKKSQMKEFDQLQKLYPSKKPLITELSPMDLRRITLDYFKFLESGERPSNYKGDFKVNKLNSVEYIETIKENAKKLNLKEKEWNENVFKLDNQQEKTNELNENKLENIKKDENKNISSVNVQKNKSENFKKETKGSNEKENNIIKKLVKFNEKHPNFMKIVKTGIIICGEAALTALSNNKSSKKSNKKISYSKEKNTVYNNVEKENSICNEIKDYEKNKDDFELDDREKTVHVQGYERTYKKTGKTVQCSPYTRRPPRKMGK